MSELASRSDGAQDPPRAPFGKRLRAAMDERGQLCVGIDPHPQLLEQWSLPDTADGAEQLAQRTLGAVTGRCAMIKPQVALFERFGAAGLGVLERLFEAARAADVLCLADAKRGDIGSTMAAYAQAWLGEGSPLAADAVTLSPYLGFESLRPAIDLAEQTGRGVFILALTSNPEAQQLQHAAIKSASFSKVSANSVAGSVVSAAAQQNLTAAREGHWGSVGLVVGATVGTATTELDLDLVAVNGPLLAPGFGAQGAVVSGLMDTFGEAIGQVLVASSRDILAAGPDVEKLRHKVDEVNATLRAGK